MAESELTKGTRSDHVENASQNDSCFPFSWWQAVLSGGAVVAGIASLLQTTFNTGLAELLNDRALNHPKSDLVAANVSFAFSTALLCAITGLSNLVLAFHTADTKRSEPAANNRNDSARFVCFSYGSAGLLGATHIVLKVITSPILGLGLDYLFVVLGQLLASLVIDSFGLMGVQKSPPTPARISAIVLALVGASVVTMSASEISHAHSAPIILVAAMLATLAGALHPVQAATMQVLRARHPSPWIVALISFSGGLLWLTVASAVSIAADRDPGELEGDWVWGLLRDVSVVDFLGGVCGVAFIALTIMITPLIGMNSFYIVSVFGQLLTAVIVDACPAASWKHALPTIPASALRIVGVATALAGIALLNLPRLIDWFKQQRIGIYSRMDDETGTINRA